MDDGDQCIYQQATSNKHKAKGSIIIPPYQVPKPPSAAKPPSPRVVHAVASAGRQSRGTLEHNYRCQCRCRRQCRLYCCCCCHSHAVPHETMADNSSTAGWTPRAPRLVGVYPIPRKMVDGVCGGGDYSYVYVYVWGIWTVKKRYQDQGSIPHFRTVREPIRQQ